MLEIALPIVFLVGLAAILLLSRSLAIGVGLVAAGFGVSGALLQFVGVRGVDFTLRSAQIWLLLTIGAMLGTALVLRTQRGSMPRTMVQQRWPWIIAGGTVVLFLASRALAPLSPAPLSSVGYLINRVSAEDNAKWVDASARLVGEMPLDTWSNVGGPLVLLLTLAASIIAGASQLLYGGMNEVAVAAGSPILAQHLLIIASPFALTPLIAAAGRIRGRKAALPGYLFVLGAGILWLATTVLLSLGHVTLQYTLLVLTLWVAAFLRPSGLVRTLASLAVATLAMVWFPLGPVSVAVILVGLIAGLRALTRNTGRGLGIGLLASFAVVAALMFEFLRSSITYSLGISAQAPASSGGAAGGVSALSFPSLPLFSDPGGTEEVTFSLLALTVFSVLGAIYSYSTAGVRIRPTLVRFAPIASLAAFASTVAILDFWAVGDGPGYGALKIAFACLIPVLAATIPIAVLAVTPQGSAGILMRGGLVGVILVVLALDTLMPRALMQLKPALWPTAADNPYWGPAEVRETGNQSLADNPIGCVYLPQGATEPSALPAGQSAYSCTRLLSGVAGLGTEAAVVTEWLLTEWLQDRSLWDSYHGYISIIPEDVKARKVVLLDGDKDVVGIESISYLLDRYPPTEDSS